MLSRNMLEYLKYQNLTAQYACGSWHDMGLQAAWDMRVGY
jgi:hypothetical protein